MVLIRERILSGNSYVEGGKDISDTYCSKFLGKRKGKHGKWERRGFWGQWGGRHRVGKWLGGVLISFFFFFEFFFQRFLFIFGTERDRAWTGDGQRERETQNRKQAPGSEPSAQSLTWGSNSRTTRSWPGWSRTINWLRHPGAPEIFILTVMVPQ